MKYQILTSLIPNFEEKLSKFNRKFAKYGEGHITYIKGETHKLRHPENYNKFISVTDIEVEGQYKVGQYEFIASLEYIEKVGKNLVRKAPNTEDIPEIYLTRTSCDHCHSDRFRKYTIILKNKENGEYIQVGTGCLKDFLGCNVNSFASYFAFFDTLEDYLDTLNKGHFNNIPVKYNTKSILEQAVAAKNQFGYISNSTITEWYKKNDPEGELDLECPFTKTSSIVFHIMNETNFEGKLLYKKYEITEDVKEEVNTILDFIKNSDENSDYINNLKILAELEYINPKNLGLVVSMVGYYLRKLHENEEKNKPEIEKSNFIGNIGDKITITAKPECIFSTESEYGMLYIYRFKQGKDELIWKTSKDLQDIELTITGTIKAHNEYKGNKQTEITRCRTKIA